MRAGFARIPITPPAGSPLTGYSARQGVSVGVHDPIYARALVLENAGAALALVSVEVLALDAGFAAEVRGRAARVTGIDAGAMLVAATHTHSGPVTIRTFFNGDERVDAAYMSCLAAAVESAIGEAWESRFPARVGTGACMVEGVGVNRRNPESGPVDRQAGILRVDDAEGRTRAVALVYGCHPTVLGFDNLLVSGDYPSAALARLESRLGPGSMGLFFNGASGNVSVGHSSELSAIGVITPGRTFERAAEIGARLGDAVCNALGSIQTRSEAPLAAESRTLDLAGREYPPLSQLEAALIAAADPKARLYAGIDCANARYLQTTRGRIPLEVLTLSVDGADFVGIGAELFAETSLAIKQTAMRPTYVIGLANGYAGYIPTAQAFAEAGYEAQAANCAPGSEALIRQAVAKQAPQPPIPKPQPPIT